MSAPTIPYPNLRQIEAAAMSGVPAAKLLVAAIGVILSLDPSLGNGRNVIEKLVAMATKLDANSQAAPR